MSKVRVHIFNGVKYEIQLTGLVDGLCDDPKNTTPHLFICADLNTKKGFITAIHEALHACNYSTKEGKVEQTAKDIAGFLWRLGYRYK